MFRSRSTSDILGRVDAICTQETNVRCDSTPQHKWNHGRDDCTEPERSCTDKQCCGTPKCKCLPTTPKVPTGGELFLRFLFRFFIFIFCLSVLVIFYLYGHERGYWKGYWKGFDAGAERSRASSLDGGPVSTPEGGPCRRWSSGICEEAEDAQSAIKWSRHYLKRGDAESAIERWDPALRYYRAAMNLGSGVGAQSANYAAKRIQFQSMTCEYTDESLARIARDFEKNTLGAPISMKNKQQALLALGYYNGPVDNQHGPESREAIRDFQGDLWFDQTGVLSAEQTVLLVCGGAQITKDISSQNVLGIMYAGGLGVRQNTDFSLDWLETAAQRGDADAAWNLALMYGTQTVLSSVRICDAVQNAQRADSYLKEAADRGHPAAKRARQKYQGATPEVRWRKLSGDLNQPESMIRVGRGCNPNN